MSFSHQVLCPREICSASGSLASDESSESRVGDVWAAPGHQSGGAALTRLTAGRSEESRQVQSNCQPHASNLPQVKLVCGGFQKLSLPPPTMLVSLVIRNICQVTPLRRLGQQCDEASHTDAFSPHKLRVNASATCPCQCSCQDERRVSFVDVFVLFFLILSCKLLK